MPLEPEEILRQLLRTHVRRMTSEFSLFVVSVRTEAELPEAVRLEVRRLQRDTDPFIRDVIGRGHREGYSSRSTCGSTCGSPNSPGSG